MTGTGLTTAELVAYAQQGLQAHLARLEAARDALTAKTRPAARRAGGSVAARVDAYLRTHAGRPVTLAEVVRALGARTRQERTTISGVLSRRDGVRRVARGVYRYGGAR